MVVGLDRFAAHFAGYQDRYALIGGAAIWLVLDEAGMDPRATKDLDIVLCVEALDPAFVTVFWEFIRAGGYKLQEKSQGAKIFYRFQHPTQPDYPAILELFSRKPDAMMLRDESHLTPISVGESVSSLSAILLDENYYELLHRHTREIAGISIVSEEGLIPLKARAWLDLTARKAGGEPIDNKDITKHKNDVLRLYQLLNPDLRIELPETVRKDFVAFLKAIAPDLQPSLLKQLGIVSVHPTEVLQILRMIYGITEGLETDE